MARRCTREAVVNAVCHRDYFEKCARVMVEICDDRVDNVSPGGVCKGPLKQAIDKRLRAIEVSDKKGLFIYWRK